MSAFLLIALLLLEPKAITVTVSPGVSFAPATLRIKVRVHPDPDDRWIAVIVDSGDFARASQWSIANDQPLYTFEYRDLPVGQYDVTAKIGHQSGHVCAEARRTVIVQGM